ncbi:MauE/DoxX family redox-associated membrane protein [Novosphingobium percolationis]|uniref:MauE/DoxX family redox-associated membrane protein n=1 Tax=Novosphingobium percolationis TaxID=2871811 RepID=UPI001CD2421A|nr:MauE/DoxX family redox-associated membrane protein [Novosphingobium percolationis]
MTALPLFLALVLGGSALHKALDRQRLASAAARLVGVRPSHGLLLLVAAAGVEAIAALCLLAPALRSTGGLLAAGLWVLYGLALARRRGETLDCGCDLVARERPVATWQIVRAFALAALALLVSALPAAGFGLDAPFAAAAFLALYLAASELSAIPHPRWRSR